MKKLALTLFIFSVTLSSLQANETCGRTAMINYQEVIIDTDSSKKGEGLRFYLEKDEQALSYLDRYQEGTRLKWHSAALGTLGSGLLVAGLFTNSASNNRSVLYIGGATLLIVNFLMAKTLEKANEENLTRAVEEYNKRNLPRIDLSQDALSQKNSSPYLSLLLFHKTWEF